MANPAIHDAATGTGTESASVGSIVHNYTVTTGATYLAVAVTVDVATDVNPVLTSDQGDTFTLLGEVIASASNQALAVYGKANPTIATHALTGSWDGGGSLSTTGSVQAVTFDNITGGVPTDVGTDSGSDSSVSTTVANAVTNDLIFDFFAANSNPTVTVGADQTQRINASTGTSGGTMYGCSSQPGANGGVMSWSWTGNQRTAQVAFRLPGPGGGGGATQRKNSLLRVGVGR